MGTRSGVLLTNQILCFGRGFWRHLKLEAGKVIECSEVSVSVPFCGRLESVEKNADDEGLTFEVSKRSKKSIGGL